jgi:osmotically-inducible protein OsmY
MSNKDLKQMIVDELAWEPSVDENSIGVEVSNGIVTLTGHVNSFAEKRAAEKATVRVAGVLAIANDIDVRLPMMRDDTTIAEAALLALRWNALVPNERIQVIVEKGWVTLEGEVDWDYQRRTAEKAIRDLLGVRGVTNSIAVKPRVMTTDVKGKIQNAFERSALIDADHIQVECIEGKVTLTGVVRTLQEREEAQHAAWSAPGVRAVDNRLIVEALTPAGKF